MGLDYYIDHGYTLDYWIQQWWQELGKPIYIAETDLAGGHCNHDIQQQIKWLRDTIKDCRNASEQGIPMRGYCLYPTVTDNLYWGSNQVHQYKCGFGDGYWGDNAGSLFRFRPDVDGTYQRVPVPEMITAFSEEVEALRVWEQTRKTR